MKKTKICIVTEYHWRADMGGAEYQIKLLLAKLEGAPNCEVYYLARHVPDDNQDGYPIFSLTSPFGLGRFAQFLDGASLYAQLKNIRPDAIYQRVAGGYVGICALYCKYNPCQLTFHIAHEQDVSADSLDINLKLPFKYIDRKISNYGIRNAHAVIAQSDVQSKLMLENLGREATAVIRNAHPAPLNSRCIDNSDHELLVVWVANFKHWKRPELFIELASHLKDMKHVRFVMVGRSSPDTQWFESLLSRIGKCANLQYLGELEQGDVNALLSQAHIFVNTSKQEGFPNTFIQSWLRGVPVVSVGVDPDRLLEAQGIGVCTKDVEELCAKVYLLLNDTDKRLCMAQKAQEYARSEFSERNLDQVLSLTLPKDTH